MSDRRVAQQVPAQSEQAGRLSPELKEFLHMLQVIEEHPDACTKDRGENH